MFWCFLGFLPVSSTLMFFYLSLTQPTLLSVPYTFSTDIDVQSLKWCHSISILATWSQSGSDVLIFVTRIAIITAISGVLQSWYYFCLSEKIFLLKNYQVLTNTVPNVRGQTFTNFRALKTLKNSCLLFSLILHYSFQHKKYDT